MARRKGSVSLRFLSKVDTSSDGCHNWLGAVSENGYGNIRIDGKTILSHRYALYLANGVWPRCSMHKCNNKLCQRVHPDHLQDGTYSENLADAAADGKHNVILNRDSVAEMRKLMQDEPSLVDREIAERFGVSRSTVTLVRHNRIWSV